MYHFELPTLHPRLYQHLDVHFGTTVPRTAHTYSLSYYLNDIKSQISSAGSSSAKGEGAMAMTPITESTWDQYKKYTNPYEFIHTVLPLPFRGFAGLAAATNHHSHNHGHNGISTIISTIALGNSITTSTTSTISTSTTSTSTTSTTNVIKPVDSKTKQLPFSKPKSKLNQTLQQLQAQPQPLPPQRHGGGGSHGICKLRPLSRAFFKMVELLHQFPELTASASLETPGAPLTTFHLAEGPGGFIEAVAKTRQCPHDVYIGMTLLDPDQKNYSIPAWKKSEHFLREFPNVHLEPGADGTGNLLSLANFQGLCERYGGTVDLVTGDGGFDFSTDFEHQEVNVVPLLFAQIACALCLQKRGGNFVLKVFDLFTASTVDLLALLSSLYDHVYLTKPVTSRYANSEKYVVCTGYRLATHELVGVYDMLYQGMEKIQSQSQQQQQQQPQGSYVHRCLAPHSVPCFFANAVAEYNTILVQQQIENIQATIHLIREHASVSDQNPDLAFSTSKRAPPTKGPETTPTQRKIQFLVQNNIQKCIQWCIKHRLPFYAVA
jgi:23S rRNA U2552 (ribose-2'-O)-methylase RlmE/FtsJ